MMARSKTLQSKAGYIDARPLTTNSTKFSCDARPDHTLGHFRLCRSKLNIPACLLRPESRHRFTPSLSVAKGHVWTAPGWQELSSRLQHWSVQPCVRPLDAVHMTAGHNALRGSGPGHKRAFETMLWPKWVVLIAGSTGSALRAVRPPNLHITPDDQRHLIRPPTRPDSCTVRP